MTQWPEKFITPGRALKLAGQVPLRLVIRDTEPGHDLGPGVSQVHLCCIDCDQSVLFLAARLLTPEDVLTAALRHRVMAHDLVLSGAGNG